MRQYAPRSLANGMSAVRAATTKGWRGKTAYIDAGQVHLLRLGDGTDRVIGLGTLARFMNAGLVYADGARIWLRHYNQLPLQ